MPASDGKVQPADSIFITQRAQVSGQKVSKSLKLPKINSAMGVESVTQSSLSTALIEANKEMAKVQQQLDQAKTDYSEHMARCNQRQEVLSMKQAKQRSEAENYERIIGVETNIKRERAEKRAKAEKALCAEKDKEVEQLKQELREQLRQVEAAKAQVDSMVKYQQYLETVVRFRSDGGGSEGGASGQGGEFQDIDEVIGKRYPTLVHAYQQLQDAVKDDTAQLESGVCVCVRARARACVCDVCESGERCRQLHRPLRSLCLLLFPPPHRPSSRLPLSIVRCSPLFCDRAP